MADDSAKGAPSQGATQEPPFWKLPRRQDSRGRSAPLPIQSLPGVRRIELNLRDINQLFNTMDPSPFHERDLDQDAEEFIVSWAQEFHGREPLELIIHLEKFPEGREPQHMVEDAVHHYFAYRARLNQLEFKRLMKQGRDSLIVGLSFLIGCLLLIELFLVNRAGTLPNLIAQSLTIAGWVAMWRPMEIYLYEWWPLRRRGAIFDKLTRVPVEVRKRT